MNRYQVVMFQRRPLPGQHSLERVFATVRDALPEDIEVVVHTMPFASRGIPNRVRNMAFAWRNRGDVNHITGDVHYLALCLPGRRTMLTIADLVSLGRLTGLARLLVELLWYRLPVRRVACVTTISEWTRSELVALLPLAAAKSAVVGCPVPTDLVPMPAPNNERPVVLQVGTGANKNLARVVEAMSGLDAHLRIIGKLSDTQLDHLSAHDVDFSHVSGISDQAMAMEYAGCDLVVFASFYEGFGLPIVEAQASGRPVVTSEAAPMSEVAGDAAVLVDPHSVEAIRGAIRSVLEDADLQRALLDRGLANARRFSPQVIAAKYAALYRTIADRR